MKSLKALVPVLFLFVFAMMNPVLLAVSQDQTADSSAGFEEWARAVSEFVGPVRFTEEDLQNFLEHWTEFSELDQDRESEEADEPEDLDEMIDFNKILQNTRYRDWAEALGFNREDWLRKSMRIISMVMRRQMISGFARAEQEMPEQMKRIEEQRSQLGEEMYQQVKRSMETSAALLRNSARAAASLPEPTPAEEALLEKYRDRISEIVEEDDEEEEEEEDWENRDR